MIIFNWYTIYKVKAKCSKFLLYLVRTLAYNRYLRGLCIFLIDWGGVRIVCHLLNQPLQRFFWLLENQPAHVLLHHPKANGVVRRSDGE